MKINKQKISKILNCLERIEINETSFIVSYAKKPFELLVSVILSQNTSDRNAIMAFKNLKDFFKEITPEKIIKTNRKIIEDLIRPSGLQKAKSKAIISSALSFLSLGGEEAFLKLEPKKAREFLLKIENVGKKTADVVLLKTHNASVFPVDTHIRRISLRLGITKKNDYDEISKAWMSIIPRERYYDYHRRLIEFGRKICRAKKPSCKDCCLKDFCEYYKKIKAKI